MTKTEEAFLFAFCFLLLWWYGMTVTSDWTIKTDWFTFSFVENDKYFVLIGLIATFIVFWCVRRGKEDYEQQPTPGY